MRRMSFDRDSSAGYLTNHMARLFARHLDERLQPLGLRIGAFPALLHLWGAEGLTQKDLVERLDIEQPTMAATLTRMERDGLITRARDAEDGRVQRILLTPRGRALEGPATAAAAAVNAQALNGLADSESAAFLTLIRRVIANLEPEQTPETQTPAPSGTGVAQAMGKP
jgi:DNA-binding MarR family transcriptional regulator